MSQVITSPFTVFFDRSGQPLDAGYIYIGTAGINPEVSPITVYWDSSLTTTAAQPIRTLAGYPSRDGSPGTIIINATSYSIVVRDRNGALVFSDLNVLVDTPNSVLYLATYADLTALTAATGLVNGGQYFVAGRAAAGDGGAGVWRYDSTSTTTADGGTVLAIDGGGTGRFFRLYEGKVIHTDWFSQDQTGLTAAAAATLSGYTLFVDRGISGLTTAVTISASFVTVRGPGARNALLTTAHASNNILTITGSFCTIEDLGFSSSVTRSGGWYVDVQSSANRFNMRKFYMSNWIGGIRIQGGASQTVESGMIFDGIATTGIAIRIDGGLDVTVRDVISDQASQIFAGVYITGGGDFTLEDLQLIHCGQALSINAAGGAVIPSVWAHNCFFDNSTRGALIESTGGTIVRCIFLECWFSSATADGCKMLVSGGGSISGVEFIGCHVFLNAVDGVTWGVGVDNVRILGGAYCQNTGSGIAVSANVNEFSVIGARIGNDFGFTGNAVGISLGGTNDNYIISGNDLRGNTSANVSGAAYSATQIVKDNLGWVTEASNYVADTTDASGDLTITHGVSSAPSEVFATTRGTSFAVIQAHTVGASTFKLRFLDEAGAAIASTAVTANWSAAA